MDACDCALVRASGFEGDAELEEATYEKYGRYERHADTKSAICGLRRERMYSSRMPPKFCCDVELNETGEGPPKPKLVEEAGGVRLA